MCAVTDTEPYKMSRKSNCSKCYFSNFVCETVEQIYLLADPISISVITERNLSLHTVTFSSFQNSRKIVECFFFLHISFQFLHMRNRLASAIFVKNRPGSPLGRLLAERVAAFPSRENLALFSSNKMGGSMDLYIYRSMGGSDLCCSMCAGSR